MKIAVSGKGGVGKTTVSAILARTFVEKGLKVLAIDADPSVNLPLSLGVPVEATAAIQPIAENADLVTEKTGVRPDTYGGVFRLSFRVDDLVDRFAVTTPSGVYLLVMGAVRSAGQGCMCPANSLVRTLLRHLLTERDEVVVVDLVAGIEHLGRGTAAHVDTMLIVSEPSLKSLETARRVFTLSKEAGIEEADVFISLTQGDNRNIMGAQIAHTIFKVPRVLCRIYDPLRRELFNSLGIEAFSPTTIFAQMLKEKLETEREEAK